MEALENREQDERAPSAPSAHASVDFKHELDPITDAEPEDESSGPPLEESHLPRSFTRACVQQRRKRHRREPGEIESGKNQDEENRGKNGEGEVHTQPYVTVEVRRRQDSLPKSLYDKSRLTAPAGPQ